MKIEIDYYSTDDATVPIGTQGYFEGTLICGHGRTPEEAKEQFIKKVSQILKTRNDLPGRETVEIPEPEAEVEAFGKYSQKL